MNVYSPLFILRPELKFSLSELAVLAPVSANTSLRHSNLATELAVSANDSQRASKAYQELRH